MIGGNRLPNVFGLFFFPSSTQKETVRRFQFGKSPNSVEDIFRRILQGSRGCLHLSLINEEANRISNNVCGNKTKGMSRTGPGKT